MNTNVHNSAFDHGKVHSCVNYDFLNFFISATDIISRRFVCFQYKKVSGSIRKFSVDYTAQVVSQCTFWAVKKKKQYFYTKLYLKSVFDLFITNKKFQE